MIIGWDIESHLIKPGMKTPKGVCVSFAWRDEAGAVHTQLLPWNDGIEQLMTYARAGHLLAAHNHTFDWGCVLAWRPDLIAEIFALFEKGKVWDTMLVQKMIDIATGNLKYQIDPSTGEFLKSRYSLDVLMLRHFREVIKKKDTWRLKYALLDDIPILSWPQDAVDYAIGDAVAALRLQEKQQADAGAPIPTIDEQHRAYLALHLSSVWGLRTDPKATAALKVDLTQKVMAARKALEGTGIYRVKGAKVSKDMKEIRKRVEAGFAAQQKNPPLTPKGQTGTAKESLEDCGDKDLAVLADIIDTDKLLTAFIPALERGFISTTYGLTESNRTTSSDFNIQQWPRGGGIRECIVAAPGWVMCSSDYSSGELCSLAQVCLDMFGYSKMAELIIEGKDLHVYFGAQIMALSTGVGIDYDEAMDRLSRGDKEVKYYRQLAKIFNFGCGGGLGAKTFVMYAKGFGVDIEESRAAQLISLWKNTFTEMLRYFAAIGELTDQDNPTLVHPRSGFVRGGLTYTSACNSLFQERIGHGGKLALWALAKEQYVDTSSPLYGCRPIAFIHDETIVAIPYDKAHPEIAAAAAQRQSDIMVSAMRTVIPDVPIRAEPTLFYRWHKGAESVYVNNILVPSRPVEQDGRVKWVHDTDQY